ncbi:PREDICTED: complex III assembly factor LYRM7-like [Cyprinodon variegatus]|uniref:complex III assembly factor LYRM7-like n=1 Tax=Cyprinodon variegatus TaxID=28743 RepID=UPI0007426DD2|nr:PREDICTED: complex III assembly factor LYRM7-like [Cyprinodon variegatus]
MDLTYNFLDQNYNFLDQNYNFLDQNYNSHIRESDYRSCNTLIMNKNEMSEENIDKMIKMGSDVEAVLREEVLQVEQVEENKLLLRDGLLLENVPYCDEPRKKS